MATSFTNTIDAAGRFPPEQGRYHLYVNDGCPFAHRSTITRKLKGLDSIITLSRVDESITENGWKFPADASEVRNGSEPDPLYGAKLIRELYLKADPSFAGRWTVPLLWDKKQHTAVNNESADTIRIFNTAFNHLLPEDKKSLDLYPEALRSQIDEANEWLADIIRSAYPAIIGATEEDKAAARAKIYALFDRLEGVLSKTKYAVGNEITEADVRVYPWILRFSIVHHALFPAGSPSIEDKYPAILAWLRRIYQRDGVSETVNVGQIQGIVLGNPSFVKAIPDGFAFARGPVLSEPIVA